MKEQKFESYFGRKIAVDASMSIYQFLVRSLLTFCQFDFSLNSLSQCIILLCEFDVMQIVVGRTGTEMLTNEAGEVTRLVIHLSLFPHL